MEGDAPVARVSFARKLGNTIRVQHQRVLDDAVPHVGLRWIILVLCLGAYVMRIYHVVMYRPDTHGYHIVTYALGIYLLNLFVTFLQPRFDPALAEKEAAENDDCSLPLKANEEFKPFIRRLPEFKFWVSAQRATVVCFTCTFFKVFDVPV